MKKTVVFVMTAMLALSLIACGKKETPATESQTEIQVETVQTTEETQPVQTETEAPASESETENEGADSVFAEIDGLKFCFYSGAGAWSTILDIAADGSFAGVFHDSEMGETGDKYPNGSQYICTFEGRFSETEKLDEYSYKLKLEDISYEKRPGVIWIEDGVRMIASEAYGLMPEEPGTIPTPDEYMLCLPGTPTADLPDGLISGLCMEMGLTDTPETLPCYVLYNVTLDTVFNAGAE